MGSGQDTNSSLHPSIADLPPWAFGAFLGAAFSLVSTFIALYNPEANIPEREYDGDVSIDNWGLFLRVPQYMLAAGEYLGWRVYGALVLTGTVLTTFVFKFFATDDRKVLGGSLGGILGGALGFIGILLSSNRRQAPWFPFLGMLSGTLIGLLLAIISSKNHRTS